MARTIKCILKSQKKVPFQIRYFLQFLINAVFFTKKCMLHQVILINKIIQSQHILFLRITNKEFCNIIIEIQYSR